MTKFMLLMNMDGGNCDTPMLEWDQADMDAHMKYLGDHVERLRQSGELVEVNALTWPKHAKVVRASGVSAPVLTDGPYAESKEVLAGYTLIDVASEERALEIAAEQSSAPGPGGVPLEQPIEVRRLMDADGDLEDF
ncbi:YciI family protein [Kribbella sp.]|uniref:YciI family protein n=1 Tax=Kribbella sp. TaxID=1871183 RepID=UPI002D62F7B3|nr:YciI family protein [Kribbella sp.]HZX02494.1 YciI family protein [Kribbella sp.]